MATTPEVGHGSVHTPERVGIVVDFAGIGSRGLAQIIDLTIITAVFVVLAFGMLLLRGTLGVWAAVLIGAGAFLIYWFYFAIFEAVWLGQTPGKRALSLRVQKVGGYPIGWTESLLRNLVRPVDGLFVYAVGLIVMLLNARSQRLGDLVAGTVVVRESAGVAVGLDELGYAVAEDELVGEAKLTHREYETLHEYLRRKGQLEPQAAQRIERSLAQSLRGRLQERGVFEPQWHELSDEVFLIHLDANHRGESVAIPTSATNRGFEAEDVGRD